MAIKPLPTPPTRQDPVNFANRADTFLAALPTFAVEVNTDLGTVADNFGHVQTVSNNIANINAAVADLPALSAKVSKTGDTMTGPLVVPAGATGSQVPQRSEVVGIAGTETITGAKTFSISPIVPAGQTGNGPARANEVARLAAANTFTTRQAIADPADQGQMAATAQGRGGLEIRVNAGMAAIALHRVNAFFAYLGLDTDNALAIGGGSFGDVRRRIYHEGNILGTVGAPGGIPNGGIFERGANANGQYIRYADGTQICWHLVATAAGGTNWVYPIGFAGTPTTVATEQDTAVARFYLANPTAGHTVLRAYEVSVSAFAAGNARVIAIGRWF